MSGFQFPPPPPPPPSKAPAPSTQQTYPNQRGGSGRGRGDRGGRGGRGRGGGNHNQNSYQHRGQGYGHGQGQDGNRGGARGGQHGRSRGGNAGHRQQGNHYPPRTNAGQEDHSTMSQPQPAGQAQAQAQLDPNALASVMSFMSTPAGLQSMAAFANHMNNGAGTQASPPEPQYTLPHHAGQKRKLNDRNETAKPHKQPKAQQQSSKPPRAKAAVPPPVPAFGFSLPTSTIQRAPAAKPTQNTDQKKRKLNLGLTQTQEVEPEQSSEEEADVDEEAAFAKKLEGGGFQFEHDGEMFIIKTEAEVAAWIKDRRKNFPTQQRIAERAQEKATKREKEIEFLRRLHGRPAKSQDTGTRNEHRGGDNQASPAQGHQAQTKKQEELAALRKKLHESMAQKHNTAPKVDLGLGYESESDSGESSILSESSVVSSSEEGSDESESESGSEDDEAPVPVSSKIAPPPIKVPPPASIPSSDTKNGICRNWAEHGRCKWSNKCRFEHPKKEGKRMGLYEVMVEQELVKNDERMLDAIKFLGQNGFLG